MKNLKSTAVDATARINDLIIELNAFYVEVTGAGISEDYEKQLLVSGLEGVTDALNKQKEVFNTQLYTDMCDEMEDEWVMYDYRDPFDYHPEY
jgi:hypothetical protein